MPYSSYANKVRKRRCPCCGEERPTDWFVASRDACWKCRGTKNDEPKNEDAVVCIVGDRQTGKTTRLIEISAATGIPIATCNFGIASHIYHQAKRNGYDIPKPLCLNGSSFERSYASHYEKGMPVLVDELQMFFQKANLRPLVVSIPTYAADFRFSESEMPPLFELLRMWWQARKERKQ